MLYGTEPPAYILQVQVSIPSVVVQTSGIQAAAGYLDATLENRNLTLSAARATGTPCPDPQAPISQHPLAPSSEQQVYVVSVTSGGAHASLGLVNSPPASSISMNSASVEVHLNRAVPTPGASAPAAAAAAAVVHAHVDFVGMTAQCCPSMLWPVVRALQQLQQQQEQQVQQQLLQHGTHPASPMPAAAAGPPDRGLVPQHGNAGSSAVPAGDLLSSPGVDLAQAAEQAGVPSVPPTVEQTAAPAAAPAATAEPAVSIQWELCLQTSSSSHVELMAASGLWLRLTYMQ